MIPAELAAELEPLVQAAGAFGMHHGASAALVVAGLVRIGTIEDIADELQRADYHRQADLVRGHDDRVGVVVVVALADGSALVSCVLRPALGAA